MEAVARGDFQRLVDFTRREHPSEGAYLEMRQPVGFEAWPRTERGVPPLLGEHAPRFADDDA